MTIWIKKPESNSSPLKLHFLKPIPHKHLNLLPENLSKSLVDLAIPELAKAHVLKPSTEMSKEWLSLEDLKKLCLILESE
jgi:hypothetical protein